MSLPDAAVKSGAKVAIGFNKTIRCPNTNVWIQNLYSALLEGKTVSEAVAYACSQDNSGDNESGVNSIDDIKICGDPDLILYTP